MIRIAAPAKVNLLLRVLAREESGYHGLETVFCGISLHDEVTVERGGSGVHLEVDGAPPTQSPADNLVVRAARRLLADVEDEGAAGETGLRIRLTKRIPAAAGLGGGSSDAAATLVAVDALLHRTGGAARLLEHAAELGSDVPFFLCGSPLALAWSRGERLLALPPLPSRPVLVAHPGVPMPTGAAFERLAALRRGRGRTPPAVIPADALATWEGVAALAANDFEPVAVEAVPAIGDALAELRDAGALVALLAGSGASVFGIFQDEPARDSADARLGARGFATWRAETLETTPLPWPDPRGRRPRERVDPLTGDG